MVISTVLIFSIFYSVLLYSVPTYWLHAIILRFAISYPLLFYSIPIYLSSVSHPILFYSDLFVVCIPSYSISLNVFHSVLLYSVMLCYILFYSLILYSIAFCSSLFYSYYIQFSNVVLYDTSPRTWLFKFSRTLLFRICIQYLRISMDKGVHSLGPSIFSSYSITYARIQVIRDVIWTEMM